MSNRPKIPCKNTILLRREQQQECRQIERNHIQELVTDTYLAIEQRDEAWDEIERLRERIERKNNIIHEQGLCIDDQQKRIEKFKGMLNTPVQCPQCNLHLGSYGVAIADSHIITRDQIRRALERLGHLCCAMNDPNVPEEMRTRFKAAAGALETMLAEDFGIVQCEECDGGGVGDIETSETTGPLGTFEFACESCHGEGWVINND